jgi:WD40 repeat protein
MLLNKPIKVLSNTDDGVLVAYSLDGKIVTTVNYGSSIIKFWDVVTGRNVASYEAGNKITLIDYSLNGSLIACVTGSTIKLIDANTRRELLVLNSESDRINSFGFSPRGDWLVASSYDLEERTLTGTDGKPQTIQVQTNRKLQIWDVATGNVIWSDSANSSVGRVRFTPDGKNIIVSMMFRAEDENIETYFISVPLTNNSGTSKLFSLNYVAPIFQLHPNGRHILIPISNNQIEVWDILAKQKTRTLEGNGTENILLDLEGSKVLGVSNKDHIINVWDFNTGRLTVSIKNE